MFQEFSDEVNQIIQGGFHDTTHATINFEHRSDALVLAHENTHGRIFKTCPDGQALNLLITSLNNQKGFVEREGEEFTQRVIDLLIDHSRFAQEATATFLPVKEFDIYKQQIQVARLPSAYREYYYVIENVISPFARTSFLQYLFAWEMAVIAFASPFIRRLLNSPLKNIKQLEENEKPDNRLKILLAGFKRIMLDGFENDLSEMVRMYMIELKMEPWDIQIEDNWHKRTGEENVKLEIFISKQFKEAIKKATGLSELYYDAIVQQRLKEEFSDAGIELNLAPSFQDICLADSNTRTEAFAMAESKIINPAATSTFMNPQDWIEQALFTSKIVVGSLDLDVNDQSFILLAFVEQNIFATTVKDGDLIYILRRLSLDHITFLFGVNGSDEVIAWFRQNPWLYTARLEEIIGSDLSHKNEYITRSAKFFYIKGNYLNVITEMKEPVISVIPDFSFIKGTLYTCNLPVNNTYFLRYYDNYSANNINTYLHSEMFKNEFAPAFAAFPQINLENLDLAVYMLYYFADEF